MVVVCKWLIWEVSLYTEGDDWKKSSTFEEKRLHPRSDSYAYATLRMLSQ